MKRRDDENDRFDGRRPIPDRRKGAGRHRGEWHGKRELKPAKGFRAKPSQTLRAAASFDDQTFERLLWLTEALGVPIASVIRDAVVAYVFVIRTKDDARAIAALQRAKKKPAQVAPGGPAIDPRSS